ncbi:MAG: cysteine--tRNA ligase [Desulfovibrionaceae bacterium]|nr:cysteine--tRNA ligase [Desulfovibrionaceae bacterium]MBF0513110.1 cysteine--tRNA ligase [Desulfovibrionaceae bacterium]
MRLYNTLSHAKEDFAPAGPSAVKMYVCGITAYDLCHIGHARSAVVFDVLVRYLRYLGMPVTFVRNFTDVDDKIINRANREGVAPEALSAKYIEAFYEDMDRLGVLRADFEPRATEYIGEMVRLAEHLIAKGHAYATPGGDVYFRVRSFAGYGKLSGRDVEDMRSGARVAPGEEKEDPLDFALWKAAKPGEPTWESPWGPGRPGWHLECSAMSEKLLGLPVDIHGGGQDLIFPHHENEIAQSEAAADKGFARFWVHNGFVRINAEKMSKSLGNFVTIRDIYACFLPETLRFFLLSSHYRSPLDYSADALAEAEKGLRRIYFALAQIEETLAATKWSPSPLPKALAEEFASLRQGWRDSLDDDLNTAGALGQIFGLARLAGRVMDDKGLRKSEGGRELLTGVREALRECGGVLGVPAGEPAQFLDALRECRLNRQGVDKAKMESLLAERAAARAAKDFALSDTLRGDLEALGVEVKDTPAGQTWDVVA